MLDSLLRSLAMSDSGLASMLTSHFECESVVLTGRGSLGIYAALRAWGGSGAVAIPGAVCPDVVAAVVMAGRCPIFVDVDPATGIAPLDEWSRARSSGADAAIVVHLYGNPADTQAVRTIFRGALVIDDAAQAFGACTGSGLVGRNGDVGVFSFGYSKQIEVGGAAIVCDDAELARACSEILANVLPSGATAAHLARERFRRRFDHARQRLVREGSINDFRGVLSGYEAALRVAWMEEWSAGIVSAIDRYPSSLATRREKAASWADGLRETGLVPVGMAGGSAPWRFACRLPGSNWAVQNAISESFRNGGVQVSNWYLPANWMIESRSEDLPGVETLAAEAFQFWLDERTSFEEIDRSIAVIRRHFSDRLDIG